MEHAECFIRESGSAVVSDDVTEDNLFGNNPGVVLQLLYNIFHLCEHPGAGELGYDEIVGEGRVTEGFGVRVGGIGVEEELKCSTGVLLLAEERR